MMMKEKRGNGRGNLTLFVLQPDRPSRWIQKGQSWLMEKVRTEPDRGWKELASLAVAKIVGKPTDMCKLLLS